MENASKALIIAGAILLSILIIGLGMAVYNNSSSSSNKANLDAQEVQAHNSQFLAYEGKQKGTQINGLLNLIQSNNNNYDDRVIMVQGSKTTTPVASPKKVVGNTSEDNLKTAKGSVTATKTALTVKSNTTYYVTFDTQDNGCISGCEIHVWSDKCGTSNEVISFTNL